MPLGGLFALAVLLPNALFYFRRPVDRPPTDEGERGDFYRLMEILERVGQVGAFAIPFFYGIDVSNLPARLALVGMAIALAFYYLAWARYFRGGRRYALLYVSLWGVPLPLAVSPVLYFLLAAVPLGTWLEAAAAVVLGIGHLYVSWGEYERVRAAWR